MVIWPFAGASGPMGKQAAEVGYQEGSQVTRVAAHPAGAWVAAGLEDGRVWRTEEGTPQGGVLSPLLANVYLHEVLDKWFTTDVLPRMRGRAFMIRYGLPELPGNAEMQRIAEPWRPHRTLASLYLWRLLQATPV